MPAANRECLDAAIRTIRDGGVFAPPVNQWTSCLLHVIDAFWAAAFSHALSFRGPPVTYEPVHRVQLVFDEHASILARGPRSSMINYES